MAYGAFLFFLSCFQSAVLLGTKESFGCPIKETPTDGIRPLLLLLFNAINQSYFMPFFYLLSGYFVKGLSSNAYTVYIVHQFVITALIVFFLRSAWPSALKFCIVALIGVPLCFFVSHFIVRKIPYSTRVLG